MLKQVPFRIPNAIITGNNCMEEQLVEQVKQKNAKKILIVSDDVLLKLGCVEKVADELKKLPVEIETFCEVEAEPSIENLEVAVEMARKRKFDLLIGLGGGSVMDTTKMISVFLTHEGAVREYLGGPKDFTKVGVPTIMLPTTSGTGAEVTINAVFNDKKAKLKRVAVSVYLMPSVAIVDPVLTLSVPPNVTAATGMDAFTHALEAYVAIKATPISDIFAEESMKRIGRSLRTAVANGDNLEARNDMSLGSLLGGIANAAASVGAVHALSYPLGGEYHLPHGVANALLLPYVVEANIIGNIKKFAKVANLLGENIEHLSDREAALKAVSAIKNLSKDVEIPLRMREFGIPKDVLPTWAKMVIETQNRLMSNNPRKLSEKAVLQIYEAAW